jgi:hypothetical protein
MEHNVRLMFEKNIYDFVATARGTENRNNVVGRKHVQEM